MSFNNNNQASGLPPQSDRMFSSDESYFMRLLEFDRSPPSGTASNDNTLLRPIAAVQSRPLQPYLTVASHNSGVPAPFNESAVILAGLPKPVYYDAEMLEYCCMHGSNVNANAKDMRNFAQGRKGIGYFHPPQLITPLEVACLLSPLVVVKKFVSLGADWRLGNPLHRASYTPPSFRSVQETLAVMKYLIDELGIDVNQHDCCSKTTTVGRPLHWAAEQLGASDHVDLLVRRGADTGAFNVSGKTPLDLAIAAKHDSPQLRAVLGHVLGDGNKHTFEEKNSYALAGFKPISARETARQGAKKDLEEFCEAAKSLPSSSSSPSSSSQPQI